MGRGNDEKEGEYFTEYPTTDRNYGLVEQVVADPTKNMEVTKKPMGEKFVWNQQHAPIEIATTGKQIPG